MLAPDVVCEHGVALDVHCCECGRPGFFPPDPDPCLKIGTIEISGVWFRRHVDTVQLLVRHEGVWKLCAEEHVGGAFSHCVHPGGIEQAPPDPVTEVD